MSVGNRGTDVDGFLTEERYRQYLRDILNDRKYGDRFDLHNYFNQLVSSNATTVFFVDEAQTLPVADYLKSVSIVGAPTPRDQHQTRSATLGLPSGPPNSGAVLSIIQGFLNPSAVQRIGIQGRVKFDTLISHLSFPGETQAHYFRPSLPSEEIQSLTIRTVSLARSSRKLYDASKTFAKCQIQMNASLAEYNRSLFTSTMNGKDVFRCISIHDPHYLSVEQHLTFLAIPADGIAWYGVILTDNGRPASRPPWIIGTSEVRSMQFHSIHDHRFINQTDNRPFDFKSLEWGQTHPNPFTSRSRTAPALGETLRAKYEESPLLFVGNMIKTSLLSWSQLLSFLSNLDLDDSLHAEELAELMCANKAVIDRGRSYLAELLPICSGRGVSLWASEATWAESEKSSDEELRNDILSLEKYADGLSQRYSDMIGVLMNRVSIAESQKGLAMAERSTQLTLLAFIFIPLSFFAGIFGMNVAEITGSTENPSIWKFVVISFPLTVIIFLMPAWEYMPWKVRSLFMS